MEAIKLFFIILNIIIVLVSSQKKFYRPCLGTDFIQASHQRLFVIDQHQIYLHKYLVAGTILTLGSTSDVVSDTDNKTAKRTMTMWDESRNKHIQLVIQKNTSGFNAIIYNSPQPSQSLTNLLINGRQYCGKPVKGPYNYYTMSKFLENIRLATEEQQNEPQPQCGQCKVKHNQLITHGNSARPGNWPWHVAIITAHCVTKTGVAVLPESLGISLGKNSLIGDDGEIQEREVFKITVHKDFTYEKLENDIALLKLRTAATFNDYIQPICFRYDKEITPAIGFGTVVGWGFNQFDSLSPSLRTANIPAVSGLTCIKKEPFYSRFLNGKMFCAGLLNGTSPCNGDSGGGFFVFTPSTEKKFTDGNWYIRGIISTALKRKNDNICDPNEYLLFTDVAQYSTWIDDNMK